MAYNYGAVLFLDFSMALFWLCHGRCRRAERHPPYVLNVVGQGLVSATAGLFALQMLLSRRSLICAA